MKNTSRILSALLCFVMIVGIFPASVIGASAAEVNGKFANSSLTVATEKNSTLAPGITQDAYTVYDSNGDQVKMFITTADMSVDTVKLFASYKDMDPTNYGMSKLTQQVEAFNKKAAAGDEYYQGTVVAGINASYYNMINGKPTGTFVMNGIDVTTESEGNAYGYFAVMKDGSVKIGNKGDYSADKGNIREAIGIYTMLIVDGQICAGLNTVQKYPRQTIGITADGNVILMTADGNQAPKSIGLTVLEQAQVMLDLGCVWAGHLDGGGSCTYAAKPEGSNDFSIANSPSDGSERSVSNGFLIVSTAVSDGKLASASLVAESEYVTPGSAVKLSATGVDSAGGPAEIPEDATWQLEDSSYGTVADGVFTSTGKCGGAVVQLAVGGKVVGEATVNVVIPDTVKFLSSEMVVPYGKSVKLELIATYGPKDVVVKASDFNFVFDNPAVGTIDGFSFTACEENAAVTGSNLTATLVYDETVVATTKLTLGKGSEVVYDFEDGTNQNVYINETPGTKYNYVWPEVTQQVVNGENGKVHGGSFALGADIDYSNSLESGYMKTSIYATETRVFENAVRVGAWIYVSDEWVGLWIRWTLRSVTGYNPDGTPIFASGTINGNNMDTGAGGTGVVYSFDEPGWHYLHVDTSAYSAVGWSANGAMMQLYISDRDGSAYDYVASENSNIPSKFRFYIDDITVDYSTAVDDREAPVFSDITYAVEGMADAAVLNNQTVSSNKVTFGTSVDDYMDKSNFTGIDASTVKAYIDGVEVECAYANGLVSVSDAVLDNGKHTVKFSACDKMGNYGCAYGYITVNSADSNSTVKLVPTNPELDRILLGSIYNMDLVATAIEDVQSVKVTIDLDNNSTWQLDHMTLAEGFEAKYAIDATENIAVIEITRVGENAETGEKAIATLPVRVWSLKTGYVYANGTKQGAQAFTYAQFKSMGEFWRMSVIANVECGVLTRVDGSVSTFTGERVFCDTEMWANKANMTATADGLAYFNAWNGGHVHSAEAMDDQAPTCTENGYTGRTYCEGCASVADWGTTVDATGHTYELSDGVVKCHCGALLNGVHTDGKTYVDGVIIADGWTESYEYYMNGVKLIGLNEIDGYYYDFGDEGVCENKARLDGFYYDKSSSSYRYFTAGKITTGEVTIFPEVYFYDANGYAVSGKVDVLGYTCYFDEKGAFAYSDDASVVDAGYSGTNIQYVLLSDGTLKVDGDGVMKDYSSSGLYPAWVIQNDATAITSLVVGNGITKIGKFGFYKNAHLKAVSFEENSSLETIGWGAFGHCWRLAAVTIPASVKVLEEYAFYECGALKSFSVEEGSQLTTIKDYAFQHDIGIETAYIPDSATNLGVGIFVKANASLVISVVENSVAEYYAIANGIKYETRAGNVYPAHSGYCNSTVAWELYPDGTLRIDGTGAMPDYTNYAQQPWANYRHLIKKIVIGKDITAIGNYNFAYTQGVESIYFEDGSALESIGVLSFFNCPKVVSVVLPETVTSIGAYGMGDCFALESVYVPQGMSFIQVTAFSNSAKVVLDVAKGTYAEEYAKANGVDYTVRSFVYVSVAKGTCGANAEWNFYENGELVISGSGAMTNFASHSAQPWANFRHLIKKVVIGKDITAVGNYAFAYCQNIEAIEFEDGSALESIGVLSFFNCPKVVSVVLPETVTSIGAYGMGDCFALESVYVPQGMSFIQVTAFSNSAKVVLDVAKGTYAEEYAKANGVDYTVRSFVYVSVAKGTCGANAEWNFYENGELVISGSGAMTNFASHSAQPWANFRHLIKKVVIGKDITAVGNYAFAYCQNIEAIEFEDGSALESIGVLSFFNCPKVVSVVLPETVTSIGAYGMGDCFALESVYVPQGMSFIQVTAFSNSAKVVLDVAKGTYAEEYAKANGVDYTVRSFVYVSVAKGTCGANAEWNFYENGELVISGSGAMTNFASHSAQPWANFRHLIKKVVIGKDITAVGNYAFAYCQNIEAIEFEDGSALESIGVLSFFNCPKVVSVVLPESIKTIGSYAFAECFNLETVYIPEGVSMIYHNAFNNSAKVVLNVKGGSFGEDFAITNKIGYTAR